MVLETSHNAKLAVALPVQFTGESDGRSWGACVCHLVCQTLNVAGLSLTGGMRSVHELGRDLPYGGRIKLFRLTFGLRY
jgi:hypothetical protein